MRFTKMEGLGNDYLYVDLFHDTLPESPETLSIKVSEPHFGVSSDGLILIEPSEKADARMRIFNADGSEAMMCGNGIRCVGKFLYDAGICPRETLTIDTRSGLRTLRLIVRDGKCQGATVDMGRAQFGGEVDCEALGARYHLHRVSMGNPHAVCLEGEGVSDAAFLAAGPVLERDEAFPDRANIEFVRLIEKDHLDVRVWERGSGRTLACGTGACAAMAAACQAGIVGRRCRVTLPGGDLMIEWREDGHIMMTGPARTVFTGEWLG